MKKIFLFFLLLVFQYAVFAQKPAHTFALSDSAFLLDGKPFQIIAGEIHYPGVPREAWRQRMQMAKAMGINTIGTYVFWNVNEPLKDVFDFNCNNDIAAFVKTAMTDVTNINFSKQTLSGTPGLKKAEFDLDEAGDTYFEMRNWGKGCIWINGHNLGRYWEIGPQQTIYVPGEWLRKGKNEVVLFELIKPDVNELATLDKPLLFELN